MYILLDYDWEMTLFRVKVRVRKVENERKMMPGLHFLKDRCARLCSDIFELNFYNTYYA